MSNPFKLIMLSAWHEQGGNVLQRHLDGHPSLFVYPFESQIATPYSSSIIDESFVPNRYRYPEFTTEMSSEQAYQVIWDQELKTYLRTPHLSKFRDCGIEMDEKARIKAFVDVCKWNASMEVGYGEEDRSLTRADYIEAFFRSTFDTWSNRASSGIETHYVGYSPPIMFNADKFFKDFPAGHMVHIVRNPWSGYADTLKRPFPMSLERYCQVWNMVQLTAKSYEQKYSNRFHIIRYENLVSDVVRTMDLVTDMLELPRSDNVYYPSFNGRQLESVYPWGTIKSATGEANMATARELTKEQTEAVWDESQLMIREFGYLGFFIGLNFT